MHFSAEKKWGYGSKYHNGMKKDYGDSSVHGDGKVLFTISFLFHEASNDYQKYQTSNYLFNL